LLKFRSVDSRTSCTAHASAAAKVSDHRPQLAAPQVRKLEAAVGRGEAAGQAAGVAGLEHGHLAARVAGHDHGHVSTAGPDVVFSAMP
jgi:hypothetical protein